MEKDWESLLDELWSYAASAPNELESKIRSCLKGHSSDGLLQAISLLLSQGQHTAARTLLAEFLISHQSANDIRRRLELILHFKKHREPHVLSIKSKARGKELLIKDVNDLVASGKLQAAESLLLEEIETVEEPEVLNLLSRVYMLQRRPTDGAKAMQRALLLKRQKQAFIEAELEESADDLPTESDLAFINGSAGQLRPLENPTAAIKTSTESAEDSFPFIQDTELNKPTLKSDDWMDIPSESQPSEASACIDQPEVEESSETALGAINDSYDDEGAKIESVPTKPLLKLARPRKEKEAADGLPKVRVFTKSGRVLNPVLSPGSGSLEPSSTADAPEEPSALPASEIPAFKPQMHEGTSDEFDVYEDQAQEIEYSEPIGLNTPDAIEHSTVLDESDDDIDFENDLLELSIFEPEEGAGDGAHSEVDDFREIEDEYAAYVYDPDEVFESEEAASFEADYWLAGRVSREERALQKAAELIGKANWPHSTLSLVQQIFVMSGWGATRLALEREIEKGLTPDELILAAL